MKYETAEKLKNAGFPQREFMIFETEKGFDSRGGHLLRDNEEGESFDPINDRTGKIKNYGKEYMRKNLHRVVYIPTLSDLISAIDTEYFSLERTRGVWYATGCAESVEIPENHKGESKQEAIANLYLSIKND